MAAQAYTDLFNTAINTSKGALPAPAPIPDEGGHEVMIANLPRPLRLSTLQPWNVAAAR